MSRPTEYKPRWVAVEGICPVCGQARVSLEEVLGVWQCACGENGLHRDMPTAAQPRGADGAER